MVGIAVWDHTDYAPAAEFGYFHYEGKDSWPDFVKNKEFFGPSKPTENLDLYEGHSE